MLAASRGSDMTLDRAYLNHDDGHTVCCWEAPSKEALAELFEKAGTPFKEMFPVEEHLAEALA